MEREAAASAPLSLHGRTRFCVAKVTNRSRITGATNQMSERQQVNIFSLCGQAVNMGESDVREMGRGERLDTMVVLHR